MNVCFFLYLLEPHSAVETVPATVVETKSNEHCVETKWGRRICKKIEHSTVKIETGERLRVPGLYNEGQPVKLRLSRGLLTRAVDVIEVDPPPFGTGPRKHYSNADQIR